MTRKQRPLVGAQPAAPSLAEDHAPSPAVHPPASDNALALAIEQNDWDRAALLLLLGISQAARSFPPATIDDVLDLLNSEERRDDHR